MDDRAEHVVLVDEADAAIGTAPKLDAHREGRLHRALSVIVRDPQGRILLQKRQAAKYHSGGLWTNTCCSHPRPDEPVQAAAGRRLREEMGFSCPLLPLVTVTYRADVGNGLIEHELVHVFAGLYAGAVQPDPREADGYDWVDARGAAGRSGVGAAALQRLVQEVLRRALGPGRRRDARRSRVSMRSVFPFSAIVGQEEMKQDPLPLLSMPLTSYQILGKTILRGQSTGEAATEDIGWFAPPAPGWGQSRSRPGLA